MQFSLSIDISDDADPGDVVIALHEAARRAADHVTDAGIPDVGGDEVDCGALRAISNVPRSFDATFYRNA